MSETTMQLTRNGDHLPSLPLQLSLYMLELRANPRPNRVPKFLRRLAKGVVSMWTHSGRSHHLLAFSSVHRRSTPSPLSSR